MSAWTDGSAVRDPAPVTDDIKPVFADLEFVLGPTSIHRRGCRWIRTGVPATEQEIAVRLTKPGARLCGHCKPEVHPAGPTPRERQEAAWAETAQSRFRAQFGVVLSARQCQEALLLLADRVGSGPVMEAVQEAGAVPAPGPRRYLPGVFS